MTQSLFIISLPRTLSTSIYHAASEALHLQKPSWVLDGEILNTDRYSHYQGTRFDESAKYTMRARDPQLFTRLQDFLDQVASPEGYAYKDVIQPFVLSEWPGLGRFAVLKIVRNLADIAYSMLNNGWFWPQNASTNPRPMRFLSMIRRVLPFRYNFHIHSMFRSHYEAVVLEGLILAERILEEIPGVTVHYDDLVLREEHLQNALLTLYPQSGALQPKYMSDRFLRKREGILRRRETARYGEIQSKIEKLKATTKLPGLKVNEMSSL